MSSEEFFYRRSGSAVPSPRKCNAPDFLREPLTITGEAFPFIETMRVDSKIAAGHFDLYRADTGKSVLSSVDQYLAYTATAMFFIDDGWGSWTGTSLSRRTTSKDDPSRPQQPYGFSLLRSERYCCFIDAVPSKTTSDCSTASEVAGRNDRPSRARTWPTGSQQASRKNRARAQRPGAGCTSRRSLEALIPSTLLRTANCAEMLYDDHHEKVIN